LYIGVLSELSDDNDGDVCVQLIRMLLIIVGVFFICWGPKLLLNVMKKHLLLVLQTDIAFNISVRTSNINDYYFSPASFALLRSV